MKKKNRKAKIVYRLPRGSKSRSETQRAFEHVLGLIESAKVRAYQSVNRELIDLYWQVGQYINRKTRIEGWGKSTVCALAAFIRKRCPGIQGFSESNLWRMRQFYDTYAELPKLAALLRVLNWTQNLLILGKSKSTEERQFYLRICSREKWSSRELEHQMNGSLFERTVLSPPKASAVLKQSYPKATKIFKDSYLFDFLNLPQSHDESDLHRGLVKNLKKFILELGRDFVFVGEEYPLQVGNKDYYLDLLFFHRELQCLVAIELKTNEFQPEHLGKLGFYLEALDRKVRKAHERPSIGVLLCATKDNEVVEFALSRSISPTLIAEYQTQMPDKDILKEKLHEFYKLAQLPA